MRKLLIDTDTASDDAVALIIALRNKAVHVEAITVVAGNVPLDLAVKNALITIEVANTYAPPVYRGATKPLLRDLFTAEYVHGTDGMGDMNLGEPRLSLSEGHASDKIIEVIRANPHEIELITLGPLTNIAIAILKDPAIARLVKSVHVMGGSGFGPGNITPVAEFNIFVDAEAAQIVLNSGMPLTFVGWDVSNDETFINQDDIDKWLASGSDIAKFCVRCNAVLKAFNATLTGKIGFDLPDPTTVVAALFPEVITHQLNAYSYVEYRSLDTYGQMVIDKDNLLKKPANVTICYKIDAQRFKEILFEHII